MNQLNEEQMQALEADIAYVRDCLEALDVEARNRALDDGEQTRWDEGMSFISEAETRLARTRQLAVVATRPGHTEVGDAPTIMRRVEAFDGDVTMLRASEARDKALKVLEDRTATAHLDDYQIDGVERVLRTRNGDLDGSRIAKMLLVTENEHYRSAFQKVTCSPTPVLTAEEGRALQAYNELRTMNIGTDSAGGFGVPVLIDPTIVLTAQGHPNDFFKISRVETITNDAWRGVSSAGVTWSFDDELEEVSDDSPVLAQPVVPVHKAQGFIPFSIEVGQDYPGFASAMNDLLREGYNELLVQKFTLGSGTGEPTGIVTALDANTNVEVAVTTDGAFGAVDIYALWAALPVRYRANASWMSSVDLQNEVRQFGTDSSHQYTINLTQESIPRLFGAPYYVNDYMAAFTGTTGAANLIIVGDFKNYLIAQRAGMTVELIPHLFHTSNNRPYGARGWYAYARVGADSVNDGAFRLGQNA